MRILPPLAFVLMVVLLPPLGNTRAAATGAVAPLEGERPLSLERKVGQLLLAGVRSPDEVAEDERWVREGKLGGVILYRGSFITPQDALALVARLQQAARETGGLPLLVAADQEGWPFNETIAGATVFPGNMALGATRRPDWAHEAARVGAREMRAMGMHWNLAPVADVNTNPDNPIIGVRSFGESPALVAEMVRASVLGYRDGGILAAAKHFPGHGDTSVDSHEGLPLVTHPMGRIRAIELVPFKAAIAAGVQTIITAHVVYPSLDAERLPATLSSNILGNLLRHELGFQGLIVGDDLEMQAITDRYHRGRGAVMAIRAGADIVILSRAGAGRDEVFSALLEAARSGEISAARLDGAVQHVLAAKQRAGVLGSPRPPVPLSEIGLAPHRALAQQIADRAVTLLRNQDRLLPLSHGIRLTAIVAAPSRFAPEVDRLQALLDRRARAQLLVLPSNPASTDIQRAVDAAAGTDVVLVGTLHWGEAFPQGQRRLAEAFVHSGHRTVFVALGNPYDLRFYPEAKTYLCSYGTTEPALEALTRVLFGEISPRGHLPVTIPNLYQVGSGMRGF